MEALQEIPREDWAAFFATFSQAHRGWLVRLWVVETVGLESGMLDNSCMMVRDLALSDLALSQHAGGADLAITTLDPHGSTHSTHPVQQVESLMLERDQDGEYSGLIINTADMQTTVLRFRNPAPPESVDGLAPQERA